MVLILHHSFLARFPSLPLLIFLYLTEHVRALTTAARDSFDINKQADMFSLKTILCAQLYSHVSLLPMDEIR